MKKKRLLFLAAFAAMVASASAQAVGDEWTETYAGFSVNFKVTSISPNEVQMGNGSNRAIDTYTAFDFKNPAETVTHEGVEYTVTAIGNMAFFNKQVGEFDVPAKVRTIGASAFNVSGLTTINFLGSEMTEFGADMAFANCDNLTSITIPANVTSIPIQCFYGCGLKEVHFATPETLTEIGMNAFNGSKLVRFEIPENVTTIGRNAFSNCEDLEEVVALGTVLSKESFQSGSNSFLTKSTCPALKNVFVPVGLIENAHSWINGIAATQDLADILGVWVKPAQAYCTFACPKALDFSAVDGLTAYAVTHNAGTSTVKLTARNNAPAKEGLLLKGTAGTRYGIPLLLTTADEIENELTGVTEETAIDPAALSASGKSLFLLYNGQFHKSYTTGSGSQNSIPANRAYLTINTVSLPATAKDMALAFSDEQSGTTLVSTVAAEPVSAPAAYNLSGQRVDSSYKGIVIVNGKKVMR